MTDFILFIFFVILFIFLSINNIKLKFKNNKIKQELFKANIEKSVLLEKILVLSDEKQNRDLEKSDDFLRFISQSRDWAFDYIEDVQKAIGDFVNNIEPEIKYFDEYGIVGDAYPHYYSMKKISGAYKELRKSIPDDYGKIDK